MITIANEPAMPTTEHGPNGGAIQGFGLTKLEYFSAMAMQGLLAEGRSESHISDIAARSVAVAHYLISALNKESDGK